MGEMNQSSAKAARMPFDHQFLDPMTMHHTQIIEMAELAQERAAHDELKKMAKKMIDDQQDIKKMQGMKEQWFAGKGEATNMQMPGMKESMKDMDKNMAKLKATKDREFDALFLTMMSKHHTDGIKMARQAESKAQHREVKDMAKKIVNSQQKEKSEMASKKKGMEIGKQVILKSASAVSIG